MQAKAYGSALALVAVLMVAPVWAVPPDHPIITEVYTDPNGLNDGPLGHDPANVDQEFIEIYLPPITNPANPLFSHRDSLKLTIYAVEGDITSSGYTLVNYRIDLPPFDLDDTNGATAAGSEPRPPNGTVVIGWLDYTNDDAGTCSDNAAPCSLLAQDCTGVGATCNPDMPTSLLGTPSTRVALIDGGITSAGDFAFVALNGSQFGGTTNFLVPVAVSDIGMPNEARSGIIQNGSEAYLLVDRDDPGYVVLYDDKDPAHQPAIPNADARLDNGSVLGVSSLLDGFAANDHIDFVVTNQPFQFGDPIDLANVLPAGTPSSRPFTRLIAQLPEFNDNGYQRLFADIPKTTEDGVTGNEDPVADALNAYLNISNLGPRFATPGRATLTNSAPDLAVAASSLQVFDLISQTSTTIGFVAANLGGNVPMEVAAVPGASSDPTSVTFLSSAPVTVMTAQSAFNPSISVTASATAVHDAMVTAPIAIQGTTINPGDPPVINPTWNTTATVHVLNPTTGLDAAGFPFEATVFVALQGIQEDPAVSNEFLGTDLGAFLAAQPDISALDTLANGPLLIDPLADLANPLVVNPLIKGLPKVGEECVNWLPRPCCSQPPGFVNTILNSAEVLSAGQSYDAGICAGDGRSCSFALQDCADLTTCINDTSKSSIGICPNTGATVIKGFRLNLPDTKTFGGTFSPSEPVHFASPTGSVGDLATGLTNVTTTRTFEVALIDTGLRNNGTIETGAADDFGIVVEVLDTEPGSPITTDDYVFLSIAGGLEGADLDTLNVPPGNNLMVVIYLDLDNLHDVLGIRSIKKLYVVDALGGSGVDIIEAFSLNLSTPLGCTVDADCADAFICNGVETCVAGTCQPGTPVNCDDLVACTTDACSEPMGTCTNTPDDAACDDGLFCNGTETCDAVLDCQAGSDPCSGMACDEVTNTCGSCVTNADCDDGLFCNGVERCIANVCQPGTVVNCGDGVMCTTDSCNEATNVCDHVPDHASCNNGIFCDGFEFCDTSLGCVNQGNPCVNPADCNEAAGDCGPTGCIVSSSPLPELLGGLSNPKNRFLSFSAGDPGRLQALLVTFVSLPAPFDLWNGMKLWVDSPRDVSQSGAAVDPIAGFGNFSAAILQCAGPQYLDWNAIGTVHVFHEGIVPGGVYDIQVIDDSCTDLTNPANYSAPLGLTTAVWGDTVDICSATGCSPANGSVGIDDALAILGRFSNIPSAIAKPRGDLEPSCLDLKINISDVISSLRGFQGLSYPFSPSTPDPCNSPCLAP